jgi:competence protein ComEA
MLKAFKNYFSVTKKQWNGLVVLMLLIVLVLASPYVYQLFYKNRAINLTGFDAAVAKLKNGNAADSNKIAVGHAKLFAFNPNHLPDAQWKKLGLIDQQIKVIKNYEAKGGRFYNKQDLKKIYVITADDYNRLQAYISLPDKADYQAKTFTIVDINTADSAKLTQIRGIGGGFATRIIRYRDRLGGFYKKEQLMEVWGVDSLMYQDIAPQLKIDAGKITKININKISLNNFTVFPYLTYKQKNALVAYRDEHGDYSRLADLLNIPIIDEGILRKIEPYIKFK